MDLVLIQVSQKFDVDQRNLYQRAECCPNAVFFSSIYNLQYPSVCECVCAAHFKMLSGLPYRLWINVFFVNAANLRIKICRKKCVNYDKIEIAQDCVNLIFNPDAFLFFLLTGAIWCFHAIYVVFTYFASFTGQEDDFLKLFLIYIDKFGDFFKSWALRSSWSLFLPSVLPYAGFSLKQSLRQLSGVERRVV